MPLEKDKSADSTKLNMLRTQCLKPKHEILKIIQNKIMQIKDNASKWPKCKWYAWLYLSRIERRSIWRGIGLIMELEHLIGASRLKP